MADVNLTRRGFEHLAKAIAGKQLTFTKVRLGDSIVKENVKNIKYRL